MSGVKEKSKVIKFPKQINIGIIIFGIIFIYLIATIIMYITAPHVTVYEVRQGSILKDHAYTGLAIRDEEVVFAEQGGYANYYVENNSKVKVGSKVYTLSDEKLNFKHVNKDVDVALSGEMVHSLALKIQSYNNQFLDNDFSGTYQLKNDMQNTIDKISHQSKFDKLEEMLSNGSKDISVKTASKDGVIVYSVDGMEDLTVDKITSEHLNKANYKNQEYGNNRLVKAGDSVYKLVKDDKWQLFIQISDETKEALADRSTVKVNFKKDNQDARASLSFLEDKKVTIACLTFTDSMIRYVNDRYVDIELIIEDQSGLKIPKTAETSKQFYVVPKSYLTQGGNSSSDGVMIRSTDKSGDVITQFKEVTVYYEEDEMVYLDPNVLKEGTILIKPDSNTTFSLAEKRSLKGVFCINKGYAVFKQIQILCESDEYYIIKDGNSFGLSNYDHIALDSTSIKENDVVF